MADVRARYSSPLAIIASAADFRLGPSGRPFGDIARARMFGTIVLRPAVHRTFILNGTIDLLHAAHCIGLSRLHRLRIDIAQDAARRLSSVFRHGSSRRSRGKGDAHYVGVLMGTSAWATVPCSARRRSSLIHARSTSATLH